MNDKSHASLESRVCLVCGTAYNTGSILLDKRLRASMERHTTTGWGLCAEHQRLFDESFVALVECNPERSGKPSAADPVKAEHAYCTSRLAHLKRESFAAVFNVQLAADHACVFVEPGIIERIQATVPPASICSLDASIQCVAPADCGAGAFFLLRLVSCSSVLAGLRAALAPQGNGLQPIAAGPGLATLKSCRTGIACVADGALPHT